MHSIGPVLALAVIALIGCAPRPTSGAQELVAAPLFTADTLPPARIGELELVGAFELHSADPEFGGISSARLDGTRLYLLSDRSTLFEVDWPKSASRSGLTVPLLAKRRLTVGGERALDSEAMVLGRDDELLVGDETNGRVHAYAGGSSEPDRQPLRLPTAFADGGIHNRGLETLARLPDGTLLAIVEGAATQDGSHVAALLDEGGARLLTYRAGDGFQVTDADVAGEWLLVLERRLSLVGWNSRIVAVPVQAVQSSATEPIAGRNLAQISGAVLGENYEGLAARAESDGAITLVIVADDNFASFQRTQLVELRWRP